MGLTTLGTQKILELPLCTWVDQLLCLSAENPDEILHSFSQSLQASNGIVHSKRTHLFPAISFLIHSQSSYHHITNAGENVVSNNPESRSLNQSTCEGMTNQTDIKIVMHMLIRGSLLPKTLNITHFPIMN
jgi:hypothetical protein